MSGPYRVVESPGPNAQDWTWAECSSPELAEQALAALLERHPDLAGRVRVVPPAPEPPPPAPPAPPPAAEEPIYFFETDQQTAAVRRTDLRRGTRPGGWVV